MKRASSSLLSKPNFGKYDILVKYTLVPSIPLSIIAVLCINPDTWVLSEIHHFYIELFAVPTCSLYYPSITWHVLIHWMTSSVCLLV